MPAEWRANVPPTLVLLYITGTFFIFWTHHIVPFESTSMTGFTILYIVLFHLSVAFTVIAFCRTMLTHPGHVPTSPVGPGRL